MPWRIRIKDRTLEWLFASYTMVFGVWLAGPESSLNPVTLRAVLDLVPEEVWAAGFSLVGALHCVALAINGAAWWTPFVRAASAGFNFGAYVFLTYAIWFASPWSSGVPTYGYLVTVGLGIVWFRALRECFILRGMWRAAE